MTRELAIFISSVGFLVFPVIAGLVFGIWKLKSKKWKISLIILFILCLIFTWARFIEPNLIITQKTQISLGFKAKIGVISDTHLGVTKNQEFLEKVVSEVNRENIDFLVIPGDFTYHPNLGNMDELFSPLAKIKVPIFAVLGNHDVEKPGPNLRRELAVSLKKANVNIIENQIVSFGNLKIVGLGDNWAGEDNLDQLNTLGSWDNVVVLAHNPDTTTKYSNNLADLTIAGHTHCGQVRIPFLYRRLLPVRGNFDKGLSKEKNTTLFITCGVGEVGLPMRLFNPPTIDILELN